MDDTVSQIDFLSATSIFYFLAGIVVLLYIAEKIQSLSRQFKISKSIPGPPGLPYIGVVHFGLIQPEGTYSCTCKEKFQNFYNFFL